MVTWKDYFLSERVLKALPTAPEENVDLIMELEKEPVREAETCSITCFRPGFKEHFGRNNASPKKSIKYSKSFNNGLWGFFDIENSHS